MYSCIKNVNTVTSLLIAYGIEEAVVCPGSQNAPLVHNLNACGKIRCQPVTDERSAGFVALGMAIRTERPVAVCVTSGSALLNLLPAVAEAYYQQVPLVILSADRPQAWIDQLDGQTLPQADALGRLVRYAVNLPEPNNETQSWHCNRLVNEALMAATHEVKGPVHINLPISRDLHNFKQIELPRERKIFSSGGKKITPGTEHPVFDAIDKARRKMIVIGQLPRSTAMAIAPLLKKLASQYTILHDCLGTETFLPFPIDTLLQNGNNLPLPDFILFLGRNLVSKPLKEWMRRQEADFWMATSTGKVEDISGSLSGLVETEAEDLLTAMASLPQNCDTAFIQAWYNLLKKAQTHIENVPLPWSQAKVVRAFEQRLNNQSVKDTVCYANSSAVRLGNLFARQHRQCNRGVNGIEGCLSTAVGMALAATQERTFCVIGDLSFFYDQNALWVQGLGPNMRVLLLNNGGGGIFTRFDGLRQSQARERLIMACHQTSAKGICESYGIDYRSVYAEDTLTEGLDFLMQTDAEGPLLLEVFTQMDEDQEALNLLNRIEHKE